MKRGWVVAVAGTAVLAVGLAGCSKEEKSSGSPVSASASASAPGGGDDSAGSGNPQVSIDGKAQDFQGKVACSTGSEGLRIEIGDRNRGVIVILTDANPPVVKTVATMGFIDQVTLQYVNGAPGGEATGTKDGNTYAISGTASAYDYNTSDNGEATTKPFEIRVTCP